jgi:hypothetical protein
VYLLDNFLWVAVNAFVSSLFALAFLEGIIENGEREKIYIMLGNQELEM